MRYCLIGLALCLAGCAHPASNIPDALLEPVPRPAREVNTVKDAGKLIVDYDQALGEANGKLIAIKEVVNC